MKRFLSIFLALTMILAMMPTSVVSAEDTVSDGTITYDFTSGTITTRGIKDERQRLERYENERDADFAEYPKDYDTPATNPKDQWIYLGMNGNYSGTTSGTPWVMIDKTESNGVLTTRIGKNQWPTSMVGDEAVGEGWLALQIYVPAAGVYDLSMEIPEGQKNTSEAVDIYLGKTASWNLDYFKSEDVAGVRTRLIAGTDKNQYTEETCSESNNVIRKGAKNFSELGIPQSYLMGNGISLRDEDGKIDIDRQFIADEAGDYLLLFHNKDLDTDGDFSRLMLEYFTLTPAKLNKTHEYIFNNTVLTGDILENAEFTENYRMFYVPDGEKRYTGNYLDSYDNVNENLTDAWCVSLLGGNIGEEGSTSYRKLFSTLSNNGLDMATRRDQANSINASARFVIQLKVKYDGIYNITADVGELIYGTDANVYMIKTSEVTEINPTVLKGYERIGTVGNVSGRPDEAIGAVSLTAGDWYMVFDFNTTNLTQSGASARQVFRLAKLTFTEIDALPESGATPEDVKSVDVPEISFSATTSIPDVEVTINGEKGNLKVLKPSRGAEISVSAPEVPGYKFIGWKEGSANDTGDGKLANTAKFVKELGQEGTFTVYTSTFLTAVYEEAEPDESADSIVEFWNLDGSYLGSKTIDKINEEGGLPTTSLIGHTFTGWFTAEDVELNIAEVVEKITHAVAGYTADATLTVTNYDCVRVNGELVSDAKAYGDTVICEDNGTGKVTHWLRDGKVVSYDPTYKYYVWDTTNISSSYAPIDKKPLVVLDGETVSDAYMIEYDGAGKTIVEVGILFGAGTPTIESKSEIFKSQRGDNHGQFAAKPTNSAHTARGYMIYKEDGSYKVIYSE